MSYRVAIIGAGPSGLMAAETLSQRDICVDIYDAMSAPGRKFLRAGIGGLNLTKNQKIDDFIANYTRGQDWLSPHLRAFGPAQVRTWADGLGAETYVGSSGKVFPKAMKAAPLLRSWLGRLTQKNVNLHLRHRWKGWGSDGKLQFVTPNSSISAQADATILALGGASWPHLGSEGNWTHFLTEKGVTIINWQPSNCGFHVAWSQHLIDHFAGQPLQTATFKHQDHTVRSSAIITHYGLEGHAIYALSSYIRDTISLERTAKLWIDLAPDLSEGTLHKTLSRPRGSKSFSSHLKRCIGFDGIRTALLYEVIPNAAKLSTDKLANLIKNLPVTCLKPRPLAEAISSAGGISLDSLTSSLMLKNCKGIFCTGEMLDWDAPTGGYLLTACLALGKSAGENTLRFLTSGP